MATLGQNLMWLPIFLILAGNGVVRADRILTPGDIAPKFTHTTSFPTTSFPTTSFPYTTTRYPYTTTTGYPYTSTTRYPYPTTTVNSYNTTRYPYPTTTGYPYTSTRYPYPTTTRYPYTTTRYPYPTTTGYPYTSTTRYPYPTTTVNLYTTTRYPYPTTTGYPYTSTRYPYPTTTGYPYTTTRYPYPTTTRHPTTTENPGHNKKVPCMSRRYNQNSIVCICNATYCDTLPPIKVLPNGTYEVYSTNQAGLRFYRSSRIFGPVIDSRKQFDNVLYVDANLRYQTIIGFGATVTDSSASNIQSLDTLTKNNLLRSYFSKNGIEYSLLQVPIGGTDYSTLPYTYNDGEEDPELHNFKLTQEDFNLKIPLIKEAKRLQSKLSLLATPWGAPAWMKSNNEISGPGTLNGLMYQSWANYIIKFLIEYKKEGLEFWGLTTGDEPIKGLHRPLVPSVGWSAVQQGSWIVNNLGPLLKKMFKDIYLIAVNDNRKYLCDYADSLLLAVQNVKKYISGFGSQWHDYNTTESNVLSKTHNKYPEKIILTTSARAASKVPISEEVQLGVWDHAENYIYNMIKDINNWSTGWIDSNLALDLKGGPTFIKDNNFEAPIIVNKFKNEFYKQPMFYAQGHFSKFAPKGSRRISIVKNVDNIDATAFIRPDKGIVVVISNRSYEVRVVVINDPRRGYMTFTATPKSVSTVLYW